MCIMNVRMCDAADDCSGLKPVCIDATSYVASHPKRACACVYEHVCVRASVGACVFARRACVFARVGVWARDCVCGCVRVFGRMRVDECVRVGECVRVCVARVWECWCAEACERQCARASVHACVW